MKELRLENVCDMDAGNAFLPEFMKHYNERFSLSAVKAEDLHRRLNVQASRLADILCHREQRHVGQQLSLAYDRRQIILERSALADGLAGQYVEIYDFADRPLEVRWKGQLLPYRIFSKDQRVSHTAIVENKRLRHALATVKAQQDIKRLPEIMTNSSIPPAPNQPPVCGAPMINPFKCLNDGPEECRTTAAIEECDPTVDRGRG